MDLDVCLSVVNSSKTGSSAEPLKTKTLNTNKLYQKLFYFTNS